MTEIREEPYDFVRFKLQSSPYKLPPTARGKPPASKHHRPPLPPQQPASTTDENQPNTAEAAVIDITDLDNDGESVEESEDQGRKKEPETVSYFTSRAAATSAILNELSQLRSMLRQREMEILRLKHENIVLKQIERRQQKELDQFEAQHEDAPRIIRGLREEISSLKAKNKEYFSHIATNTRQLRNLNNRIEHLREQTSKYEKLVKSMELTDKESLKSDLEKAQQRAEEQTQLANEVAKKLELIQKNGSNENRQLRLRIHNLQCENRCLKDKTDEQEATIREKEKEIASLSIYRFNAVHRKTEALCKQCQKREKKENAMKRKQATLEKLPVLNAPLVEILSANCVAVTVSFSTKLPVQQQTSDAVTNTAKPEISTVTLECSDDPSFSRMVKKYVLKAQDFVRKLDTKDTNSTESLTAKNSEGSPSEQQSQDSDQMTARTVIDGLDSGKFYFFQVFASHEGVDGNSVRLLDGCLVDAIPNPPPAPRVSVLTESNPSIDLYIDTSQYHTQQQGPSGPVQYRIYHSNDPDMNETFLVGEVKATMEVEGGHADENSASQNKPPEIRLVTEPTEGGSGVTQEGGQGDEGATAEEAPGKISQRQHLLKFNYKPVQLCVPHFFQVSAVNALGESAKSERSEVTMIDLAPARPTKPVIEKLSPTSIKVSCMVPPNGGSPITEYHILIKKAQKQPQQSDKQQPEQQQSEAVTEPPSTTYAYSDPKEIRIPAPSFSESSQPFPTNSSVAAPSLPNCSAAYRLVYVVGDLQSGTSYAVTVGAVNAVGDSMYSEISEIVELDFVIPTPPQPQVTVTSSTSVTINFNNQNASELGLDSNGISVLKGRRIVSVEDVIADPNERNWHVEENFIPLDQNEWTLQNLKTGGHYNFAVCYVTENEGEFREKDAIASSRNPLLAPDVGFGFANSWFFFRITFNSGTSVYAFICFVSSSTKSSLINLSKNQKVTNMHHGRPSHEVPPDHPEAVATGQANHEEVKNDAPAPRQVEESKPSNILVLLLAIFYSHLCIMRGDHVVNGTKFDMLFMTSKISESSFTLPSHQYLQTLEEVNNVREPFHATQPKKQLVSA
ncbi:Lebercilin [Quaeritorhiza haematococci]|nr:Lebercilin [Quaeritorhiza haematococci]